MSPTDLLVSLAHHTLLLQLAGVCSSQSFRVSCPSYRGLETREMVQPSTGPADPGGDVAASYHRANPTTPSTDRLLLWAISWVNCPPRLICLYQSGSPGVAQKAPRLQVAKAQLVAASQKQGCGGGSKGIHLEDSSAPGGSKWRKRSNQPDSSNNCCLQYEDMFEDSDDSNESFDGPFSGPSLSAVASSTTGNTSQSSK